MVYMWINKNYFEKNKQAALEKCIEETGEKENPDYVFDLKENSQDVGIEENKLTVDVSSDVGTVFIEIPLTIELLSQILEYTSKRINKIKALLEAAK